MTKFTYDDIVYALVGAVPQDRVGTRAWIVGVAVEDKRVGFYYERFPPGTVYTVEFEDGTSTDVHEAELALYQEGDGST